MKSTVALMSSSEQDMHNPLAGMALLLKPLMAFWYRVSRPFSVLGCQAAASPRTGALLAPVVWQAVQKVLYTCSGLWAPAPADATRTPPANTTNDLEQT